MVVNIISLNVRGIKNSIKRRAIFDHYRSRCDWLCLQETHLTEQTCKTWANEWGGQIIFSHGETNARGVAICVKKQSNCCISNVYSDHEGRYCAINVEQNGKNVRVCNIYAPNKDSPGFFNNIFRKELENIHQLVLIGDFNLTLNNNLDRNFSQSKSNNENAAKTILSQMDELTLSDVWRIRNPEAKRYSWYRRLNRNSQSSFTASRIDFRLISNGMLDQVHNTMYLAGIQTDHSAFFVGLDMKKFYRGPGFWKFNTTLLSNGDFLIAIKNLIARCKIEYQGLHLIEAWELLKQDCQKFAKNYSKVVAEDAKLLIAQLTEKVTHMEDDFANLSPEDLDLLENTKIDLEEQISKRTHGLMFRSKAKWLMEGERNTSIAWKKPGVILKIVMRS